MTAIAPLITLATWKVLEAHYAKVRELHLRQLFADDPKRGERLTAEAVGWRRGVEGEIEEAGN
jgi:glucose-6-phosphate isomerase